MVATHRTVHLRFYSYFGRLSQQSGFPCRIMYKCLSHNTQIQWLNVVTFILLTNLKSGQGSQGTVKCFIQSKMELESSEILVFHISADW